jgi:hypothetical protein
MEHVRKKLGTDLTRTSIHAGYAAIAIIFPMGIDSPYLLDVGNGIRQYVTGFQFFLEGGIFQIIVESLFRHVIGIYGGL